ncbi:Ig-like domain-containing protein [Acetobacterium woodii]|uniref:Fibronectin type-III domain-containing protein n=1 Tax=Acetobacterium woodii (strain ATCC 29683 / DSM 1030 / JCM 2381 / KCTC 1655 / WB1) TaxID=931626 RepID=H6LFD7_ACEWD|nr:Ig-like domain-containing protein [Acetobacterium woodii]AFA49424.1 hypothetical protein Awo_c26710 [Acetobacterium woodii DSM 1030]
MRKSYIVILMTILLMGTVLTANVFAAAKDDQTNGAKAAIGLSTISASQSVDVTYHTHVQNQGWEPIWVTDGAAAGTVGQSLRLEGIEIKLNGDLPEGAKIEYRTHVQNQGWEKYWICDGYASGSQGMGLRLEGIQIRLVNMPEYSVQYRTHVQNQGWEKSWAKDGETSGTEGQGLRLEGIQIRIVREDADLSAYKKVLATAKSCVKVDYSTYSWNVLQTAIADNVVTVSNTQEEVDAATQAIQAAYDGLETEAQAMVYDQAGTFGPNSGVEIINKDVMVKADGVILQNFHIKGNLIITEEVGQGNVTLNNITVDGETYVRGGGQNSIHINGGDYKNIIVQETSSGKVRIVATNAKGLAVIIAEDANGEDLILEGHFESVQVNAPQMNISTQGTTVIDKMVIAKDAAGSSVNLDQNSRIEKMVLNGKTAVKGQGRIVHADVNADHITYEKAPDNQTIGGNVKVPPTAPPVSVTGITVSSVNDETTLEKGSTLQMNAIVTPEDATNNKVIWSVANGTGMASISSTGLLTAVKVGTVTVKATARDGSEKNGTKLITITEIQAGTIATTSTITAGAVNPIITITLTNDTFTSKVTAIGNWDNAMGATGLSIAAITKDSNQQVTIKMTGTSKSGIIKLSAKAAALTKGLASNTLSIEGASVLVTNIMVTTPGNVTTVDRGKTLQMAVAVLPATATNKNITWSVITGTGTATIDSSGILVPTTAGSITVKATAQDGSEKYGTITITIQEPVTTTIATASHIANGETNPGIVVTLMNDTFTASADSLSNWDIKSGETGLTVDAASKTSGSQVTFYTKGTAKFGELTLKAKAGALTKGLASNVLSIKIAGISDFAETEKTDKTVSFSWTAATGATTVKLQQSLKGANSWTDSNTEVLSGISTHATVTELSPATAYDFRLVVVGGTYSGFSNVLENIITKETVIVRSDNDVLQDAGNTGGTALDYNFVGATKVLKIDAKNKNLPYYPKSGSTPPSDENWLGLLIPVPMGVDTTKVTATMNTNNCSDLFLADGNYIEYIPVKGADLTDGKATYTWTINWGSGYAPETITINLINVAGLETLADTYITQVIKTNELSKSGGAYATSFTWRSSKGVGKQNVTTSGSYNYYEDGAYLRFQIGKVETDGSVTVMKFSDVLETGSAENDTVGGMTLQTGTGTVCDMDGSSRERADWGLSGYEGYKTNLPNDGNYLFYGLIQNATVGTKTVGFASGDERSVNLTLTPKTGLVAGSYRLIIETVHQGFENDGNSNSIAYDFTV